MAAVLQNAQVQTLLDEVDKFIDSKHGGAAARTLRGADRGVLFEFTIDYTKSDPSKMVVLEQPIGQQLPTTVEDWMEYLNIHPCVVQNGEVQYYLNPSDYNQMTDYTDSEISTFKNPEDPDVMIEIPRIGIQAYQENKDHLKLWVSTRYDEPGFDYSAFSRDGWDDCDRIYVGAYLANGLNSHPGKMIDRSTIDEIRAKFEDTTSPKNTTTGYFPLSYSVVELLQVISCLVRSTVDGEATQKSPNIGKEQTTTGGSEAYGMFGETFPKNATRIKYCGLEDFWGNGWQYEDGIIKGARDAEGYSTILRALNASATNMTGEGYRPICMLKVPDYATLTGSFITRMNGIPGAIFFPSIGNGSSSTYFGDRYYLENAQSPSMFGGDINIYQTVNDGSAGLFIRKFGDATSDKCATRIVYMHKRGQ